MFSINPINPINPIDVNYCCNFHIEDPKKIEIAKELSIDPNILNICEELASREVLFKQSIIDWYLKIYQCMESQQEYFRWTKEELIHLSKVFLNCYINECDKLTIKSYNPLKFLPEFFYFPSLEIIEINNCHLESMPEYFFLPNLKHLNLTENQLTEIPKNLKLCKKLEKLIIPNNQINELPEEFDFEKLELLDLSSNNLTSIPKSFNCPALKFLILEDNENIEELPLNLAYCFDLQCIYIDGTLIPDDIVDLIFKKQEELENAEMIGSTLGRWNEQLDPNLDAHSDLWLPMEMIGEIAEIGNMHGYEGEYSDKAVTLAQKTYGEFQIATTLRICHEIITMDPGDSDEILFKQSIVKWCVEKYEKNENMNMVIDVARKILNCYTERSYTLSFSNHGLLKSLPDNLYLPNLRYLNLESAGLEVFPKNFYLPNLKWLNVSKNRLFTLPEDLLECKKLEFLLAVNAEIYFLPKKLHFPLLKKLRLEHNLIERFPYDFELPFLKKLNLSRNGLTSFPDNCEFPSLKKLDLRSNFLKSFPENCVFPKLENLNLSMNELESLPNNCEFPSLKKLILTQNPLLQQLPIDLAHRDDLEIINEQEMKVSEKLEEGEMTTRWPSEKNERPDNDFDLEIPTAMEIIGETEEESGKSESHIVPASFPNQFLGSRKRKR